MPSVEKIISDIICAEKNSNIKFRDLQRVLDVMGFRCRIKGDHFIYYKDGINEIINIQLKGNKVKPYQVKQIDPGAVHSGFPQHGCRTFPDGIVRKLCHVGDLMSKIRQPCRNIGFRTAVSHIK